MGRPVTLFTGQWADLPLETLAEKAAAWGFDGLELATWGDHFDVSRAEDPSLPAGEARAARSPRPGLLGDLRPPRRPVRVRPPARRAPRGDPAAARVGRRRSRGRPRPRGGGDQGDPARRGALRRFDRQRVHRLEHLAHARGLPARPAGDDRRGLRGLRRPLEPDHRRGRRGRRALRAGGAPVRDRLRLLDDRADARGDRPPPRVRAELRPEPHGLAAPGPRPVPRGLRRPHLPRPRQGHEEPAATGAAACSRATSASATCAAAGTSCPSDTATSTSSGSPGA